MNYQELTSEQHKELQVKAVPNTEGFVSTGGSCAVFADFADFIVEENGVKSVVWSYENRHYMQGLK